MLARQPFLPSQSVQRLLRRYIRNSSRHRVLVGPPDPVSNLRPVIYDEGERGLGTGKDGESAPRSSPTHPYSLDEFDGDPTDYQWRIERKRLDAYNHVFWTESNTRFEAAKQALLDDLPEDATPEHREAVLSEFYKHWLLQERVRLKEYSDEWSRRNFAAIYLAARAAIKDFRARVLGTDNKSSFSNPNHDRQSPTRPPNSESKRSDQERDS